MTDRYRVYTKVLKVPKGMMKLSHPGHLVTLAMIIAGIVTGRKAQLTAVSAETGVEAKDKSIEMLIAEKKTGQIDRTDRTDKSLFRLGLDWIHHALKRNLGFEPVFRFQFNESFAMVEKPRLGSFPISAILAFMLEKPRSSNEAFIS